MERWRKKYTKLIVDKILISKISSNLVNLDDYIVSFWIISSEINMKAIFENIYQKKLSKIIY